MNTTMETLDVLTPGSPRIADLFQRAGKAKILSLIIVLMARTAAADWWAGTQVSMGVRYVLPIMMAATVFRPSAVVLLSVVCAVLGLRFYRPDSTLETTLHFFFTLAANLCSGLFMHSVIRNRQIVVRHVDQMKREGTWNPCSGLGSDRRDGTGKHYRGDVGGGFFEAGPQ
jgi:hypothetical protein